MKHIDIVVKGRVQGVFFRVSAAEKAKELGVYGFAKNIDDGSVYIEAEGEEVDLNKFIDWCRKGPPMASVRSIHLAEPHSKLKGFKEFGIEF